MNPVSKPLWQRFLTFLLPLMAANILQSLSGTINNIFVGQLLGVKALATVSVFFPLMIFLISFVIGISAGATVLIGQAYGARNIDKVKQVAGTALAMTLIFGLAVALIGLLFADQLVTLLGTPRDIAGDATGYLRVFMVGIPTLFVFLIVTSILRGVGDTVTPLISLVASIVVGVVVTPVLILGWFGLPRLGINASAIATIAGFALVLVFLFFYMRARKLPLAPDRVLLRNLRIDPQIFRMIIKLGVPMGVQMVVSSIAAMVIIGIINRFGSNATAAYGVLNQVMTYVQFPAMSIAIASSIFAAQAIGGGRIGQLGAITRTGLLMNLLITGLLVLIAYLFSQSMVRLFVTDPEVINLTQRLLHIILWSIIMFGAQGVLAAVMRASGTVLWPMLISLGTIALIETPLAIWLSTIYGLDGIWAAYATSFTTMLVLQALYYQLVWRKKTIKALI